MSARGEAGHADQRHAPSSSANRAQRSHSTVQVPVQLREFSSATTPFLHYKTSDFIYDLRTCPWSRRQNGFKETLLSAWYAARDRKAFNYDLNCVYKLLDGDYDLSFQLNVERGTLRRKPMRFKNIRQPFDHLRFNFTKLLGGELLYHLRCVDRPYTDDKLDLLHTLAVNASPLEKGHALIIPSVSRCLPQVLNHAAIRIALDLMLIMEDETFHVLFNSLLGQASVNHLHLHTLFWPYESGIVTRRCDVLHKNVYFLRRPDWYIHSFVFQLGGPEHFDEFISNLSNCAAFLTNENVAHNLFMTRAPPIKTNRADTATSDDDERPNGGPQLVTAYLFPRRNHTGAKPATNFNPAALELAGFLTAYTYRFFESANEQMALRIIDEDAVLSEDIIDELCEGLTRRYAVELPWEHLQPVTADAASKAVDGNRSAHLLSVSFGRQRTHRRYSHCLSESSGKDAICEELGGLDLKHNDESLTTHELEELADTFHTVTTPVLQPRHYSFNNRKSE